MHIQHVTQTPPLATLGLSKLPLQEKKTIKSESAVAVCILYTQKHM